MFTILNTKLSIIIDVDNVNNVKKYKHRIRGMVAILVNVFVAIFECFQCFSKAPLQLVVKIWVSVVNTVWNVNKKVVDIVFDNQQQDIIGCKIIKQYNNRRFLFYSLSLLVFLWCLIRVLVVIVLRSVEMLWLIWIYNRLYYNYLDLKQC